MVERYQDRAFGLALRLLRSEPDAEEVTQDAFVRAWRSLADFRGDSGFGTWLYRIVWRRAVDRAVTLRTRQKREESLDAPAGSEEGRREARSAGVAVQEEPTGAERSEWMRLTEGLSEPQQAAVTLFYYHDMALKDVARALEMPEGTVKTHLSRARAALRAKLADQRENDDV